MLEVKELTCTRGEQLLFESVSFKLAGGELLQVQGPNGSGKTTLLRALCGFIQPTAGIVRWRDENISELGEEYLSEIIYLGHLNAIKDELNPLENLRISSELSGYPVSISTGMAVLKRMGLRGRETFPVKALSQGQRRRVALARLLVSNAPLWILDEPLTALDVGAVTLIQEMIEVHLGKRGMVIFTTHQPLQVAGIETRYLSLS